VNALRRTAYRKPRLLRAFNMKGSRRPQFLRVPQDGSRDLAATGLAQLAATPGPVGRLVPVLPGKHI
jgi:hypothetical protein